MFDPSQYQWFKLWFRGRTAEEEKYVLLHKSESDVETCLEEWVHDLNPTSDHYRYGFEDIESPPTEVLTELLAQVERREEVVKFDRMAYLHYLG